MQIALGCVLLLLTPVPQEPAPALVEDELPVYRPEEALLCVDRKVAGPAERGL